MTIGLKSDLILGVKDHDCILKIQTMLLKMEEALGFIKRHYL